MPKKYSKTPYKTYLKLKKKTHKNKTKTKSRNQKGGFNLNIDFSLNRDLLIIYEDNSCALLSIIEKPLASIPSVKVLNIYEYSFILPSNLYDKNLKHLYIKNFNIATKGNVKIHDQNRFGDLILKYWSFAMQVNHKDTMIIDNKHVKTCITGCYVKEMTSDITSYNVCALISFGIRLYQLWESQGATSNYFVPLKKNVRIDSMVLNWSNTNIMHGYIPDIPTSCDYMLDRNPKGLLIRTQAREKSDEPDCKEVKLEGFNSISYISQDSEWDEKKIIYGAHGQTYKLKHRSSINLILKNNMNNDSCVITYYYKNFMNGVLIRALCNVCNIINIDSEPKIHSEIIGIKSNILMISNGIEDHRSFNVAYVFNKDINEVIKIKNFVVSAESFDNLTQNSDYKLLYVEKATPRELYNINDYVHVKKLIKDLFGNYEKQIMENLNPMYSYKHQDNINNFFRIGETTKIIKLVMFCVELFLNINQKHEMDDSKIVYILRHNKQNNNICNISFNNNNINILNNQTQGNNITINIQQSTINFDISFIEGSRSWIFILTIKTPNESTHILSQELSMDVIDYHENISLDAPNASNNNKSNNSVLPNSEHVSNYKMDIYKTLLFMTQLIKINNSKNKSILNGNGMENEDDAPLDVNLNR
jgi:hypothetical protein